MGLFSKVTGVCSVCGSNIISLNIQNISNGMICNSCREKASPYLQHFEIMTAQDVIEHLKCRDNNRLNFEWFQPTRILLAPRSDADELYGKPVYVDENNGCFLFSNNSDYIRNNADVFSYNDFRSFSYTESVMDKRAYIHITIRVYSEICRSIIKETYEWSVELPFRYRKKPHEYREYMAILSEVQNTEAFFNMMTMASNEPVVPPLPNENIDVVNVCCPNCGAMTTVSGPNAECEFCGLTIENIYYKEEELNDAESSQLEDHEEYDDESDNEEDEELENNYAARDYNDDYGEGFLDNPFGGVQSDSYEPGFSYNSNNIEVPEINIGGGREVLQNASDRVTPPPITNQTNVSPSGLVGNNSSGRPVPPPLRTSGNKATPPSLDNAIKRTASKQITGSPIKDGLIKGSTQQVRSAVTKPPVGMVGQKAGQYAAKQASIQAGRNMAMQAGKQMGKGVAVNAGNMVAKQAANTAGRAVAKQAVNTAGRAVAKQAMNTAGRAVAKQAMNTAGRTIAKQAAKSAGKAVAKQATKSVAKSVGKAAAKGALNSLKKMF